MNLKIEFQEWIQEVTLRNGFEVFIKKMKMNLQNGIRFKDKNEFEKWKWI